MVDCLGRVDFEVPENAPAATCVATIASAGFETLLDDMLGSLAANGACGDAALVVLVVDGDTACARVASAHGATIVECTARVPSNPTLKAVLYSIAHIVAADRFLCLDADVLVLGSLEPVLAALEAAPPHAILACPEGDKRLTLGEAFHRIYAGDAREAARLAMKPAHAAYPLVVNDGVFAARAEALLALDADVRSLDAVAWVDDRPDVWWRNQFVFNLALARLDCGVRLDRAFNVQLHVEDVTVSRDDDGRVRARCADGVEAVVLHFGGVGRQKHPEVRGLFARVHA